MAKRKGLEAKLAQMFVVGLPGSELEKPSAEFLAEYQPGGVIFFAHNYEGVALLAEMTGEIQNTRDKATPPLFVGVDHEGGRVQRFKKPFTHFPEPAILGDINSPKLAFMVAEVMAKELRAVGVNLNFHPLCDIHTRPSNPVIGKRAFGSDDELVSKMASAMVRGFIANRVIACAKHFPGHGDTTVDSHIDLPKMDVPWEKLLEREIKPFSRVIRSRVDMIMTAHILNAALDPIYPATLSYSTVTNRLRKELRYSKLVITDDMTMDAVDKHFGADRIVLAINAGCDLLLYRTEEKGREAMDTAFKFLEQGRISAEQVEAAYARIKEVKERVLMPYNPPVMEDLSKIIGCEAHQEVLRMVVERRKPGGEMPE